jgi:hypothetical protein
MVNGEYWGTEADRGELTLYAIAHVSGVEMHVEVVWGMAIQSRIPNSS